MAQFGAHVRQGDRNGYGGLCAAKPAVVLSLDDGGALLEAKTKSGGYTVTIFRDTSVYLEAPPDFDTYPDMTQLAQYWYQQLRVKWLQNPSDYKTITNEIGGNDPAVMRRLVEYEREIMRLANDEGLKVVVLNQATGTPESLDQWKQIYAPLIVEAWVGKNLYGRHVYGTGDLVATDGNVIPGDPQRPFTELGYLRSIGAAGGIVLSECGLDAGFGFAGIDRFRTQMGGYEKLLRAYPEFVGSCGWTLGTWKPFGGDANWQDAIPAMTQYLIDNPTPKWEWPTAVTPVPPTLPPAAIEDHLWSVSNSVPHINLSDALGLWKLAASHGYSPLHTEVPATFDSDTYAVQQAKKEGQPNRLYVYEPGKPLYYLEEGQTPPQPPQFRATAWPTPTLRTTQWFAANPQNYAQFGLPGHDGQDGRAFTGEPIKAIANGTVYLAGPSSDSPNYGIQVRIDHGNGHKTVSAHLQQVSVSVGQVVTAGQVIGLADSTGNSTGSHWHGTYKQDGETYTDPAGNVWPRNLFDPWLVLEPLYLDYLNQAGIAGYVWANSTIEHLHFDWGFGATNLNLRKESNGGSPSLGLVQAGVPFWIAGARTATGYYPVIALLGDTVPGSVPVPEPGNLIDLRRFKVADPDCWRVVRNQRGQQEDVQDMELGGGVYVRRKNNLAEWHKRDGTFFYLIHDTSPAPGAEGIERVYTLYKSNVPGAPKSKIQQVVGELWTESGTHLVQFRAKDGCRNLSENSGNATNSSKITRYEKNYTFNGYGQNLTFEEVVWEQTGGETQIYGRRNGRSCGWIGWQETPTSPVTEPVEIYFDRGKMTVEPNRYCNWT